MVIKFLPRNSQRKGGKLDDKFSGPYITDELTDLGIARLQMPKEKLLRKGVPIKQLQKYNRPNDDDNYSSTSNEIEKEEQPKKRRWIFIDSEMNDSDVDVVTVSPHVNHEHSIRDGKMEEKQEVSVKQSVTLMKHIEAKPSVKQSVTLMKHDEAKPCVKLSVTLTKHNEAKPSVKQSVTPKMPNVQDWFRSTPANIKDGNKKISTPMKSLINHIKGGVKKLKTHTTKFFFPYFTNSTDKITTFLMLMKLNLVLNCVIPSQTFLMKILHRQMDKKHQKNCLIHTYRKLGLMKGIQYFFSDIKQHKEKHYSIFQPNGHEQGYATNVKLQTGRHSTGFETPG